MNLIPTSLGADRKRLVILGGLVVLLGAVYFINRTSGSGAPQPQAASNLPNDPVAIKRLPSTSGTPLLSQRQTGRRGETGIEDFKPSFKLPEGTDVSRIDPTLKLDLMAKLRELPQEGGERSLFDFGAPPKPKEPPPPVQPIKPVTPAPDPATAETPAAPVAPVKPPPPPIPLKFYGYVNASRGGLRQAFFLDGDDIFVAGENDVIRSRYKVIRIGVNSAVVEDTTNKNQQTLPLIEELPG
jgi:hypothetical protein